MMRKILYLAVALVTLFSTETILHAQDLTLAVVECPKTAKAGQDLKSTVRLLAENTGDTIQKGITLEIILRNSPLCPKTGRPAAYSPNYYDGVLLSEGREYITLEPDKTLSITPSGVNTIPWNTPAGRTYYLCGVLDPENKVKETNKDNNCACCAIKIIGAEEGPLVTRFMESCLVPGRSLTIFGRNFGPEIGTVTALSTYGLTINFSVSSWSDSSVVVQIPNDSRMQEGQQYMVNIMHRGGQSGSITGGKSIGICPTPKKDSVPVPETMQFSPPFFYNQQQIRQNGQ